MIEERLTSEIGCRRDEVRSILRKFDLSGAAFGDEEIYPRLLACVRQVVLLRVAGIGIERIAKLWETERKIIELLHGDSHGSPTWLVDGWGEKGKGTQRLFLTRYATGADLSGLAVQQGLNFSSDLPELFEGGEMGEDALQILKSYRKRYQALISLIQNAEPLLSEAAKWAKRF